jgi:hypothetical protein
MVWASQRSDRYGMGQSAFGPLWIGVSAPRIRPLRIELVLFTTLSPFTGRCSVLCTTAQSQG